MEGTEYKLYLYLFFTVKTKGGYAKKRFLLHVPQKLCAQTNADEINF